MRSFASLLPARPSSLLALSAEFLDRSGADADAIKSGVTIIECPDILVTDICDAIDELSRDSRLRQRIEAAFAVEVLDGFSLLRKRARRGAAA